MKPLLGKKTNSLSASNSSADEKLVVKNIYDFQRKVTFADPETRRLMSHITSTIYRATHFSNATELEAIRFLLGAAVEIAIQHNPVLSSIKFYIGDVVICNFGTHVHGEISGAQVNSIVCDIRSDGAVYLLPITKQNLDGNPLEYMPIIANQDVFYSNPKFDGGTVLLRMGKYVRPERIRDVVGTISESFFAELLQRFHDSMDFRKNVCSSSGTAFNEVPVAATLGEPLEEEIPGISVPTNGTSYADDYQVPAQVNPTTKSDVTTKAPTFEEYLQNSWNTVLDAGGSELTIEGKAQLFLTALDFSDPFGLVCDALVASCSVKRITNNSILSSLVNTTKNSREHIKEALSLAHKQWLSMLPENAEQYSTTSLTTILKFFAKKVK